jgi:hypothetical protein
MPEAAVSNGGGVASPRASCCLRQIGRMNIFRQQREGGVRPRNASARNVASPASPVSTVALLPATPASLSTDRPSVRTFSQDSSSSSAIRPPTRPLAPMTAIIRSSSCFSARLDRTRMRRGTNSGGDGPRGHVSRVGCTIATAMTCWFCHSLESRTGAIPRCGYCTTDASGQSSCRDTNGAVGAFVPKSGCSPTVISRRAGWASIWPRGGPQ